MTAYPVAPCHRQVGGAVTEGVSTAPLNSWLPPKVAAAMNMYSSYLLSCNPAKKAVDEQERVWVHGRRGFLLGGGLVCNVSGCAKVGLG